MADSLGEFCPPHFVGCGETAHVEGRWGREKLHSHHMATSRQERLETQSSSQGNLVNGLPCFLWTPPLKGSPCSQQNQAKKNPLTPGPGRMGHFQSKVLEVQILLLYLIIQRI